MSEISTAYSAILQRINQAVEIHLTPTQVKLLAVSKRQPVEKVRSLYALGQSAFGENYQQEAAAKMQALADLDIEWHFIGPIQSNKSRKIAETFAWVQSVDSEKLLRRLSAQRPEELPTLNILLQVNIDNEIQKRGIATSEVNAFARLALELPNICLRGLMAIPDPHNSPTEELFSLKKMARLFADIQPLSTNIDTLSMGMSADIETAIKAGSTMVRVGTALFGQRPV